MLILHERKACRVLLPSCDRCQSCGIWRRRVRYQHCCGRPSGVLSWDALNVESALHQQMSSLPSLSRTCPHDCQQSRAAVHRQESAGSPETQRCSSVTRPKWIANSRTDDELQDSRSAESGLNAARSLNTSSWNGKIVTILLTTDGSLFQIIHLVFQQGVQLHANFYDAVLKFWPLSAIATVVVSWADLIAVMVSNFA